MKECMVCHKRTLGLFTFMGERLAFCSSCDPGQFKTFMYGVGCGFAKLEE